MTALEYYHDLILKSDLGPRQPITDGQRAAWLQRMKQRWPQLAVEEISRLINECTEIIDSGKQFDPLIEDIVNHIPGDLQKRLPQGFVGEFPVNDLNGLSMITPSNEYLILINRGLTVALQQWAKLVINIFVNWMEFQHSKNPGEHFEQIMTIMRYSLTGYIQRKEIPSFPVYLEEPNATLSTVLGMSASRFVLAHEYAHILLGHLDQKNAFTDSQNRSRSEKGWLKSIWKRITKQEDFDFVPEPAGYLKHIDIYYARRSWRQELNADSLALELLFTNIDERPLTFSTSMTSVRNPQTGPRLFDIEMTLAGIGFLFGLHNLLDRLQVSQIMQTHPPMHVRWDGIRSFLDKRLNMNQYVFANTIGGIMTEMASHLSH
ncbi:MAG TPA: M48 family metalloprotease [Pyrinomonadaceae bacterium]